MESNKNKRRSGERPRKKRFNGNKYVNSKKSQKDRKISASDRKLKSSYTKESLSKSFLGYRMMDIALLFENLEKHLVCKTCKGEIKIVEKSVSGLSSTFQISCKICKENNIFRNNKLLGAKSNIPEINRRAVFAMRCIGKSLTDLKTFCSVMCLQNPVSQKSYDAINRKICTAASSTAEISMHNAVLQESSMTDGSIDITVSGDGTWKTRGHSSLIGACVVIGANSGKVIDTHVMSSFCKGCESYKGSKSGERFQMWKKNHAKVCKRNHDGSAGKMEVSGMVSIFSRSLEKHGVRYVNYIGDGDTKTFLSLKDKKPYDDININKVECVGHVQKRMGSRLKKLKMQMQKTKLSDGKTIGGKGRLTDSLILKLSSHYGNAIRGNSKSVSEMRRAIWAVWSHTASSDKEPMHFFCPKGENSWCKYNRAALNNEHFTHKNTVPLPVMLAIKPIFKDLSHPDLLKRCLDGKTQNPNESYNSTLWKYCPKTIGSGRKITEIAASIATVIFNDGTKGIIEVMKNLDLAISKCALENFCEKDKIRIRTAENRAKAATHEYRKARKRQKISENESNKLLEGTMYASGAF